MGFCKTWHLKPWLQHSQATSLHLRATQPCLGTWGKIMACHLLLGTKWGHSFVWEGSADKTVGVSVEEKVLTCTALVKGKMNFFHQNLGIICAWRWSKWQMTEGCDKPSCIRHNSFLPFLFCITRIYMYLWDEGTQLMTNDQLQVCPDKTWFY